MTAFAAIILLSIPYVQHIFGSEIYHDSAIEKSTTRAGIVFGAGLNPDGTPREMLEARVIKGVELLQTGKVATLIFSGARELGHNEPEAMKAYALSRGVHSEQLITDEKGDTTFHTCKNASELLGNAEVLLITQKFHLPRALYLCNQLGLRAIGVPASSTDGVAEKMYARREYLASVKAWLMINIPKLRPYLEKVEG